jgi:hypothetical protein
MGILPVFIITEMKWSWEHAKEMGLQFEETKDAEGNILDYEGHFLYADRGQLNTIEDVAVYIADLMDEQAKGNLPFDMCFFWELCLLNLVIILIKRYYFPEKKILLILIL